MNKFCPTHGIVPTGHTHGRWSKGSNSAWRRQRAIQLRKDNYRCTEPNCNEPADEVHHVSSSVLRSVCYAHNPRGG